LVIDAAEGWSMKRFVEGQDRRQGVLLPEFLDDWVSEENPVRAIDVFVDVRIRRATVEHPFGTLKAWMVATHFKTKTLARVRTETRTAHPPVTAPTRTRPPRAIRVRSARCEGFDPSPPSEGTAPVTRRQCAGHSFPHWV
jgi:hypothetical protein